MKKILVYGMSNNYGGIQSFFLNLIHHSDNAHVQYDFALSSASPVEYASHIKKHGGEIHALTPWGENPLKHKKQFKQLLEKNMYDYVWVNATSASNTSVYKIVKSHSKAKLIIHAHGSAFETRNKGAKKRVLGLLHKINKGKLLKYGDVLFAVSKEASQWLFSDSKNHNKSVHIINNGIDTKKYAFNSKIRKSIRESLNLEDTFVLIQVGRIERVKNHSFTLDVFKSLVTKEKDSKLLIIGTGSLEKDIKEMAQKLNIHKQIEFLGYQTNISDYLMAADCLILPSYSEGLPLTVVEAQAAGLKSIVSTEAVPESADVTGLVSYLSLHDPAELWAEKIVSFAKDYSRESQYEVMKDRGFDVTTTVYEVNNLLDL